MAVEHFQPDVILTDIAMPGQDGYEFLRWLRVHADRSLAKTPAIAVTAHARAEDRQLALSAGFQHYISKPVDAVQLVTVVATVVRRQ